MKRSIMLAVACVVAVLAILAARMFMSSPAKAPVVEKSANKAAHRRAIPETRPVVRQTRERGRERAAGTNAAARPRRRTVRVKIEDSYTRAERALADRLQDASDENSLDAVREAVADIMKQGNPDLKVEAIDALGFYGKDSLTDMMAFLRDKNQTVVDAAVDRIAQALDELQDNENTFKAEFITTLLSTKGLCGKDAVDRFVGILEAFGSGDEKLAVQTIVFVLEGDDVAEDVKARVKEAYKFVTTEDYTTFEEAEKWFSDKAAEEQMDAEAEADDADEDDD